MKNNTFPLLFVRNSVCTLKPTFRCYCNNARCVIASAQNNKRNHSSTFVHLQYNQDAQIPRLVKTGHSETVRACCAAGVFPSINRPGLMISEPPRVLSLILSWLPPSFSPGCHNASITVSSNRLQHVVMIVTNFSMFAYNLWLAISQPNLFIVDR